MVPAGLPYDVYLMPHDIPATCASVTLLLGYEDDFLGHDDDLCTAYLTTQNCDSVNLRTCLSFWGVAIYRGMATRSVFLDSARLDMAG